MNNKQSFIGWTTLLLTALTASGPVTATTGEQWEYLGKVEMSGMQMDLPPAKLCQKPEEGNTPPVEDNCTTSDVQVQGNTTNYKVKCAPPDAMEGTGSTTRTGDKLVAKLSLNSADGAMIYTMSGTKLGTCTPK